jgi:hypothetical protein
MTIHRTSSKKTALKLVAKTPRTKAGKPSDREAIIQEVLDAVSWTDMSPEDPPKRDSGYSQDFFINNHFAFNASQVHTDLAMAAQCEANNCFSSDDGDALDCYSSSEYGKLRQTFLDELRDAVQGRAEKKPHVDPFLNLFLRAYNAGRLCPERREPDSAYVCRQRHQERVEQKRAAAK